MEISQIEREQLIFLLKLKDFKLLEKYLLINIDDEDIIKRAEFVFNNNLVFVEYDDDGYKILAYECPYCGYGQHKKERLCRAKKYFKHKIDCPKLIAKDFLTGIKS